MLWNALLLALREIRRNLMRSSLTILGIVIGVASVIIMVNLGSGATAQVSSQIASLGSNLLMVRTGQRLGFGQRSEAEPFRLDDAVAIADRLPVERFRTGKAVDAVPSHYLQPRVVFGKHPVFDIQVSVVPAGK